MMKCIDCNKEFDTTKSNLGYLRLDYGTGYNIICTSCFNAAPKQEDEEDEDWE